jgi:hypothetical protein
MAENSAFALKPFAVFSPVKNWSASGFFFLKRSVVFGKKSPRNNLIERFGGAQCQIKITFVTFATSR